MCRIVSFSLLLLQGQTCHIPCLLFLLAEEPLLLVYRLYCFRLLCEVALKLQYDCGGVGDTACNQQPDSIGTLLLGGVQLDPR